MAVYYPDSRPVVLKIPVAGPQGPTGPAGTQGAQGPAGPSGGAAISVTAASAIGGHRIVVLDDAGAPAYASNQDINHLSKVLGMTLNAANPGDTLSIVRTGDVVEPTWNWTLNLPVFLGTNGLLTQTPPSTPALFSQVVGFPITATKMFVNIREPILLS